jgi:sulfite exporter TauE/SafE
MQKYSGTISKNNRLNQCYPEGHAARPTNYMLDFSDRWKDNLFSMLSIDTLYYIFLTTGFTVGFGHCIGMCGPIVVSFSLNLKERRIFFPHLFYNAGRITTYAILGGVMGMTGSFTAVTSRMVGLQKGAMIFAGLLIIFMGVLMSGWIPFSTVFRDHFSPRGFISRGYQKLTQNTSVIAFYPLGILLGLLPCGPVYTALIAAARSGMEAKTAIQGFLNGMGLMISFGIGTVPALMLVAKLADLGWLKSRSIIYKVGAVIMIIVGVYFMVKGIRY